MTDPDQWIQPALEAITQTHELIRGATVATNAAAIALADAGEDILTRCTILLSTLTVAAKAADRLAADIEALRDQ